MYVSVKGGERAITAAHKLLAEERRGDPTVPELTLAQIEQQMSLGVSRVMSPTAATSSRAGSRLRKTGASSGSGSPHGQVSLRHGARRCCRQELSAATNFG